MHKIKIRYNKIKFFHLCIRVNSIFRKIIQDMQRNYTARRRLARCGASQGKRIATSSEHKMQCYISCKQEM